MIGEYQSKPTRIWWDGSEVQFIRWTDRALVFSWGDPRETAIHMPRGAVARLVEKGVMRIEGTVPTWPSLDIPPLRDEPRAPVFAPHAAPEPVKPAVPLTAPPPPAVSTKMNIISRLIRKLSGGTEQEKAGAAS